MGVKIDIVDLRNSKYLSFYIEGHYIYCENIKTLERVIVGDADKRDMYNVYKENKILKEEHKQLEEILARLKDNDFERDCNDGSVFKELNLSTIETLIDCITNLQEENRQLKEYEKRNNNALKVINGYFTEGFDDEYDMLNNIQDKLKGSE